MEYRLLTTELAAKYLNISKVYLRNMRHGQHSYLGPKFSKLPHPRGFACYYSVLDLDKWKEEHKASVKTRKF